MALIKCRECKGNLSTEANICPHCGAKQKNKSGCLTSVLIFVLIIVFFNASGNNQKKEPENTNKTPAELRKEKIEKAFSQWEGSHTNLKTYIINAMNDPDSFQHIRTKYIDDGKNINVCTEFRGKNAFGGVVKNTVCAKTDIDGRIIEIISE